jgi:hypothetical protein
MAAFGTKSLHYRPSQDMSTIPVEGAAVLPLRTNAKPHTNLTPVKPTTLTAGERLVPGSGGRVREIFPLLWRAIPLIGDHRVNSVTRPGDELPPAVEEDGPENAVLPTIAKTEEREPAPPVQAAPAAPIYPAPIYKDPAMAVPSRLVIAPQSHSDLIRAIAGAAKVPATPYPQPPAAQTFAGAPQAAPTPARPTMVWPPAKSAPAAAPAAEAYPAAVAPDPAQAQAPAQPYYPPYYPQPGQMPPQQAPWPQMPWPQQAYPQPYPGAMPQNFVPYPPPFNQMGGPMGGQMFGPGVHPAYPYGYPPIVPLGLQQGVPGPYAAPPAPEPPAMEAPPPQPAPAPPQPTRAPANLSEMFAAMQRKTPSRPPQ